MINKTKKKRYKITICEIYENTVMVEPDEASSKEEARKLVKFAWEYGCFGAVEDGDRKKTTITVKEELLK